MRDEPQERRDRRIPKLVIDVCRYVEQLPNLAGLEGDLEDTLLSTVREGLDLGIKDRYPRASMG